MIPVDAKTAILEEYEHGIRLQYYDTSMKNEQEEVFKDMRGSFGKLMGLFFVDDEFAKIFAECIVKSVDDFKSKAKTITNATYFVKRVEFIMKMLEMLTMSAPLMNQFVPA